MNLWFQITWSSIILLVYNWRVSLLSFLWREKLSSLWTLSLQFLFSFRRCVVYLSSHLFKWVSFDWGIILSCISLSTWSFDVKDVLLFSRRHVCSFSKIFLSLLNFENCELIVRIWSSWFLCLVERLYNSCCLLSIKWFSLNVLLKFENFWFSIFMFWIEFSNWKFRTCRWRSFCLRFLFSRWFIMLVGTLKKSKIAKIKKFLHLFESVLATAAHI